MSTANNVIVEPAVCAARARRHGDDTRQRHGVRPHTTRWALLIAQRYSLTLAEARAELRRLAANGWQPWEFHTAFSNDLKDDVE